MGEGVELAIVLAARDAASSVLSGVGEKLDKLGKAGDVAKVALGALTAGIGAAVFAGVDFAKAAADEQVGVERLTQAIRNTGTYWDGMNDIIEQNIAAMERSTAFSDGEMRDALALLVTEVGDVDGAMDRMTIAADFARGAHIDLMTASKLLGKVTDENVNVLARYGIHVEKGAKATDLLREVQERFGGQAGKFAETATGKWQIFSNQVDNLKEDIGGALLPVFSTLADFATGAIDAIRKAFADPAVAGAIQTIIGVFTTAKDILGEMFGVITGMAPDAGVALKGVVGPEIAGAIMSSLAFVRELFKAVLSGDVPRIIATLKDRAADLLGGLMSFLKESGPKIANALMAWAKELIAWIGPQIEPMLNELLGLLTSALHWLGDHAEEIGQTLVQWGLKFGEFILTTAIPAILEHLPGILLTIGKWVLTEAIPGVVGFFVKLGVGMIEGLMNGLGGLKDAIVEKVKSSLGQAIQGIKDFLGIKSPSTVFEEIGKQVMAGFASGVVKNKQLAFDALDQVYSRIAAGGTAITPGFGRGGGTMAAGWDGQRHFEREVDPADVRAGWAGRNNESHIYIDGKEVNAVVSERQLRDVRQAGGAV